MPQIAKGLVFSFKTEWKMKSYISELSGMNPYLGSQRTIESSSWFRTKEGRTAELFPDTMTWILLIG